MVIPAFRVKSKIIDVVTKSLEFADQVLVVDDCCPEKSGAFVDKEFRGDNRVSVIIHPENSGVGGAMKSGFLWALERDFSLVVKVDGDGQMNPSLIPGLISPIVEGDADYAKGNRFHSPRALRAMPKTRIMGNAGLSLLSKLSSGYWSVSDPTNGFVAISTDMLRNIELDKLSSGYFFESDLLFRLSITKARVSEFRMDAKYSDEVSSLNVGRALITFPIFHLRNYIKRILYLYYIREWSIGSIELPLGLAMIFGGVSFGLSSFNDRRSLGLEVTAGESVATAIAIILGFQLLLSFLSQDIQNEPRPHRANKA